MLISILLPTRERFDLMIESIKSLYEKANDPTKIELLLKLDNDNYKEYMDRVGEIHEITTNVKIVISDRKDGYDSLHHFFNELGGVSEGEFLFIWNDDSTMITEGWDKYVAEYSGELCILQLDAKSEPNWIFPMVHRKIYEILNHISLNPSSDTWLHFLAELADIEKFEDRILIHHNKQEEPNEEDMKLRHQSLYSPAQIKLRMEDANKIFAYLMEN